MSRITKLELARQNEELRLRLAVADGNVAAYRARCEKLEDELAALSAQPARKAVPSVQAKPLTPFQVAAQKARALAVSTGRCVMVG